MLLGAGRVIDGPERAGPTDEGVGNSPLPGGRRSLATLRYARDDNRRMSFPRSLNKKKDERPDLPSEASLSLGPICEHRRHRCSKSALGVAVDSIVPTGCPRGAVPPGCAVATFQARPSSLTQIRRVEIA